jgi:chorismate synthase
MVKNKDFKINELPHVTKPRPGHADLAGVIKYDREDARDILERASARETTYAPRPLLRSLARRLWRSN